MQNSLSIQIDVIENEPRVSAIVIADNTNVKYESIRDIIKKYNDELSIFGEIPFADLKSVKQVQGRVKQVALLNEQQTTLLMTFLKNTKEVIEFKVNLIKAFFMMKEKLNGQLQTQGIPFNLQDIKRACIEAVKDEFLETKYIIKDELKETRSIIRDVLSNVIAENQNFLDEAKSVVSTKSLTAEQLDILKTRIENKAKELSTSKKIRYEIAIKTIYSDLNSYYGIKSWYHLMQGDYDEALFVINNVSLDRGA
ncbi:MAG: Rha family transcriptional regulator [Aliarcobacter sp.]|nr:Rha family transcriptional regulator [Aliarcobacter sp.]